MTIGSSISKESHYSTSSTIDFKSKYLSKEEEYRDWINKITSKMQDQNLKCDTSEEILAVFDAKC